MPLIHFQTDDRTVEASRDESILEASLRAGIPHTHVCGGVARCTTCRIMIVEGDESCVTSPTELEAALAEKFGFARNIRLACQARACGDLSARRLVIDDADVALAELCSKGKTVNSTGLECNAVILFADIRDFTAFSDKQLPYDVIHMLNRYFYLMRNIVERHHGQIYNYMGDGLLALFGVEDPDAAAENGVRAGLDMLRAMDDMQDYLQNTYKEALQIGVGVHRGEVVIGTMDQTGGSYRMVIGDAVNIASRVESQNKTTGTRFLVSQPVYEELGDRLEVGKTCAVEIKGKTGEHTVYEVRALA